MPTAPICNICKSKLKPLGTHPEDLESWQEDPIWLNDPILTQHGLAGDSYFGKTNIKKIHIDQLIVYWSGICTSLSIAFPPKLTMFLATKQKSISKADIVSLRLVVEQCLEESGLTIADYFKRDKYGEEEYTTAQVDWTDVDRIEKVPYIPERCSIKAIHVEELRRGISLGFWKETWDPTIPAVTLNRERINFIPGWGDITPNIAYVRGLVDGDHSWEWTSAFSIAMPYFLFPTVTQKQTINIGGTLALTAEQEVIPNLTPNEYGAFDTTTNAFSLPLGQGHFRVALKGSPGQYVEYHITSSSFSGSWANLTGNYTSGTVTTFPDLAEVVVTFYREGKLEGTWDKYRFSTDILNTNPGVGKLKFNRADLTGTPGRVVIMRIAYTYIEDSEPVSIEEILKKLKPMSIRITDPMSLIMPTLNIGSTFTTTIIEGVSGLGPFVSSPGFCISIRLTVIYPGGNSLFQSLNYYWGTPGYRYYNGSYPLLPYPDNTFIINPIATHSGEFKRNLYEDYKVQFPTAINAIITGVIFSHTMTNMDYAHPYTFPTWAWSSHSSINVAFNDTFIKPIE
jgi:hypothetical protein